MGALQGAHNKGTLKGAHSKGHTTVHSNGQRAGANDKGRTEGGAHDTGYTTAHNNADTRGPGKKVSTSTVAALFSKKALTGQRITMVGMVLLVFSAFPYLL